MPDGVHVPGLAAHQIAGLFPVEKGKVLHQKPSEKLVAHVVEHPLGAALEDHLVRETKRSPHQRHRQQDEDQPGQKVKFAPLDHVVHDKTGNVRVYDGQHCEHSGHDETQDQQRAILFQKTPEPFHWCHKKVLLVCQLIFLITFPNNYCLFY